MSNKTIFIQGTAEVTVPATESISISNYGGGIAKIFYLIVTSNFPPAYQFQQAIENEGIILGPFAVATKVKIEALNSTVVYDIGASPSGGIGDAETLGGQPGSYYLDADNINAGTISDARLPGTISSDTTGNAATATDSDTLDGVQGSDYARISQINTFTANNFITKTTPLLQLTDDFDGRYFKISIYAGTHYLQFSGASGANGGDVYLTGADGAPAGTLYTNEGGSTYKFWHEGNDGSGSGLDADTLDGYGTSTTSVGSTVAVRDSSNQILAGRFLADEYITVGSASYINSTIYFWDQNSSDWRIFLWDGTLDDWYAEDNTGVNRKIWHEGNDSGLVHTSGDESISGIKTFNSQCNFLNDFIVVGNNLIAGQDSSGNAFMQFWDDTNNAYRSIGWDDTNHYWFMEDSGGTNRQVWTAAENASVGAGSGVTGSFTTSDAKTVTVTNGIITSIV